VSTDLATTLRSVDTETLGQWYCQLNTWKVPDDFPVKVSGEIGVRCENTEFDAAYTSVFCALGEKGASRAWWLYQLKRTEDEWSAWWNNGRMCSGPLSMLIESCNAMELKPLPAPPEIEQ